MQEVQIDTTELSHPEPFVLAMEALKSLKSGQYIKMIHRREPLKLYEVCDKLKYAFFVEMVNEKLIHIYICDDAHKTELSKILEKVSLKTPKNYSDASCNTCEVLENS